MGRIDVANLRVRGEPSRFGAMAFLVEDALRTAIGDEERLVLVRTLPLGSLASRDSPYQRTRQVEAAWRGATGSRVHGAASGAAAANCVWFASSAEARRVLLDHLLAGREPRDWFWRIAVPEWRQRPLEQWLVEDFAAALEAGDIARIATFVIALGVARTATIALAATAQLAPMLRARSVGKPSPSGVPREAKAVAEVEGAASDDVQAQLQQEVTACRARLAPRLRDPIERLAAGLGLAHPLTALLIERLLLSASPSLALVPQRLAAMAIVYREVIARAVPVAPPHTAVAPTKEREPTPPVATPISAALAAEANSGSTPVIPFSSPVDDPDPETEQEAPPDRAPASLALTPESEVFSPAAGLFLILPALRRLGFREWLTTHPELLGDDPGRGLLRHIAHHYHVAPDDPLFVPLGERQGLPLDWARVWRIGLDRWLRRTARLSLAALIWRGGGLSFPEEHSVRVRFPLDAIDIRLRRHALDADPGWTDWLGLSVRYRFSEREWS